MTSQKIVHEHLTALSRRIIGSALEVHKEIGPGYPERMYARAMQLELKKHEIPFEVERSIRVRYKDQLLGIHRLDLVVGDAVVVELKSVYEINNFHIAQMLSYLKASEKVLGLIFNFGRARLEIKRVVL